MSKTHVAIVGAGINGLVAANYLARGGCSVTMIERADRVGGACVSEIANIDGRSQHYALGASTLGLMQDFVYEETGLASRLQTYVPEHPKLIHFPGNDEPAWIYRDPAELDRELANKWGESGDVEAFREDEARVVDFLQEGYVNAAPPTLDDARAVLGSTLTDLWISGSARSLLDHYFTSEKSKIYMAMMITESGPVSLDAPYSAFTLPLMDSGSIFGGHYGYVKGGIWRITEELGRINTELGVDTRLGTAVVDVDTDLGQVTIESDSSEERLSFDRLILGTDPLTAARVVGKAELTQNVESKHFRGSSGKLNLMFRNPVRWKHGSDSADSDSAFRFLFCVDKLTDFEEATLAVMDETANYVPGYLQIYCEGAAMRQLKDDDAFDRLAVFFKNLSLNEHGDNLPEVEEKAKQQILRLVKNPEDCVWSRLLTPKDLQQLFLFPGGNLDHTMLTGGQSYFDRNFSAAPDKHFYRFGDYENIYLCGSGTYPCGSVAGTPGYMCSQNVLTDCS